MYAFVLSPILPLGNYSGAGLNNQVQVSGKVCNNAAIIEFRSLDGTFATSSPIINGQYSLIAKAGQSYNVVLRGNGELETVALFVPSGINAFIHDFN